MNERRWSSCRRLVVALGLIASALTGVACESAMVSPQGDCVFDAQYRMQCSWEEPATPADAITKP
ncbi:MAG: hypothetical protein K0V04_16630 [Deltaproteobacteria bacterium]|nr:hypothetical protein [Deltaproteobacteria bacterium]